MSNQLFHHIWYVFDIF